MLTCLKPFCTQAAAARCACATYAAAKARLGLKAEQRRRLLRCWSISATQPEFKRLVEASESGIAVEDDAYSRVRMFDSINETRHDG